MAHNHSLKIGKNLLLVVVSVALFIGLSQGFAKVSANTEPSFSLTQVQPRNVTQRVESLLDRVIARGRLVCGVNGSLPVFSFTDSSGHYSGLDVDICRAVSTAIFANPDQVEFRNLDTQSRFPALANGQVDLLSRNSTWTLSRDATGGNGFDFAAPVFYDGQGILARKNISINQLRGLQGKSICVETGTITELNLAEQMRQRGFSYSQVGFADSSSAFAAYFAGQCDAITTDRSLLAVRRTSASNPIEHVVWDTLLSQEPLTPLMVGNDSRWSDVIRWVIYGLVQAEEYGITQANIQASLSNSNPNIKIFLGLESNLGEQLGLPNDFMVAVISAVGNYGEIYDRNFGNQSLIKLPRGPNNLWSRGGLMYSPAWR